jgi:hypothetical protein
VLLVLKEEQDDSDSLDGDFDGIEESLPVVKVGNLRNIEKRARLTPQSGTQYHEQKYHKIMGQIFIRRDESTA